MKYLIVTLLILGIIFASSGSSNLNQALNQLEDTSRSLLGVTALIGFGVGLVFTVIALSIHFFVKGIQGALKIVMFICGIIGVLALLGGILSIILYLFAPSIMNGLLGR